MMLSSGWTFNILQTFSTQLMLQSSIARAVKDVYRNNSIDDATWTAEMARILLAPKHFSGEFE
jgi:hypothetical protein